jgi:endoglucanase
MPHRRPRITLPRARATHVLWAAALALLLFVAQNAAATAAQGRNPFAGRRLYVDPNSPARRQEVAWRRSRPREAALMRRIADQPQVFWVGGWVRDARAEVSSLVTRVTRAGALPVVVAYNIPHRDCGSYSAGGARGGDAYRRWMAAFAQGIGRRTTVVILEPDALAGIECLPLRLQDERYVLLRESIRTLRQSGAIVYLDAGHARWRSPAEMAERLRKAGIEIADGFALNVSNYHSVAENLAYGERLSRLVGGKHFVVDTSRNGRGSAAPSQWCNPRNMALGRAPTAQTGHPLADAFLWVKTPGESDGTCNGGPRAGEWWPDYALELSRAAEALGGGLPR